jgi:hypothetical protein
LNRLLAIGRTTYEPGWKWSVHVGVEAGAASCGVEHVGMVICGRATAAMDNHAPEDSEPQEEKSSGGGGGGAGTFAKQNQ